jgi:hypothetical protein
MPTIIRARKVTGIPLFQIGEKSERAARQDDARQDDSASGFVTARFKIIPDMPRQAAVPQSQSRSPHHEVAP